MNKHMVDRLKRLHRRMRGVTLMELLVVVMIIGILAAIGVPTYRKYMLRSQRSEAKIALLQLQTAQEKHYLQNNEYTDDITGASPDGLGMLSTTETGKYELTVALEADGAGNANQAFTATAEPTDEGGQSDDADCNEFTITDRGVKGVSGTMSVEHCWK